MHNYNSRIYIGVHKESDWKKLKGLSLGCYILEGDNLDNLWQTKGKTFYIDKNWACTENNLYAIVKELVDILRGDCYIYADTFSNNINPENYVIHYLGDHIHEHKVEGYQFQQSSILNLEDWARINNVNLTLQRKEHVLKVNKK